MDGSSNKSIFNIRLWSSVEWNTMGRRWRRRKHDRSFSGWKYLDGSRCNGSNYFYIIWVRSGVEWNTICCRWTGNKQYHLLTRWSYLGSRNKCIFNPRKRSGVEWNTMGCGWIGSNCDRLFPRRNYMVWCTRIDDDLYISR